MSTHEDPAAMLHELLEGLARFGGHGTGVTRLAYSDVWCEAQRWLAGRARGLGLAATTDAAGNLFFHDPSLVPGEGAPPVLLVGSHLDTVVSGGRYDGACGAVAGLVAAVALRARGALPVVGFVTCEEEGSRFPSPFMGARSLLGQVEEAELDAVRDGDGVAWRAALESARARGCAAPLAPGPRPFLPLFRSARMLELHIEQGPVLEAEGLELGIVTHIAGFRRLRARLTGEARHAGATPMRLRRDALAAAAEIALAVESYAKSLGEPAVATAGFARAEPGLYNVIAGACDLGLEVRHVEPGRPAAMAAEVEQLARGVAERRGVALEIVEVSGQDPTAFAAPLVAAAESLAKERGLRFRTMASGAGHDAMVFAHADVPALVVFVPSRGGISHAPEEYTPPEQLAAGLGFAIELARRVSAEQA